MTTTETTAMTDRYSYEKHATGYTLYDGRSSEQHGYNIANMREVDHLRLDGLMQAANRAGSPAPAAEPVDATDDREQHDREHEISGLLMQLVMGRDAAQGMRLSGRIQELITASNAWHAGQEPTL